MKYGFDGKSVELEFNRVFGDQFKKIFKTKCIFNKSKNKVK